MLDGNFGYKSLDDEIQNFIPKIMVYWGDWLLGDCP